ncbi:hypothetical protein HDU81_006083 [Chytriomyces hyalinus]|nr:hypothetical protein HDU81_006083 [Chytriomyces hyalinus]
MASTDPVWQPMNQQQAPPNPPNAVAPPPPEPTVLPPSSSAVPNVISSTIAESAVLSSTTVTSTASARIQISSSIDSLASSASNASSSSNNNSTTSNFIPLLFAYVASVLVLGFLLGGYCFYYKRRQRFRQANLNWSPPTSGRVSVSKGATAAALELPQKRNDDLDILSSAKTRLSYIRTYPQLYELAVDPRLRESRIVNSSSPIKQQKAIINSGQAVIRSSVCVEQKVVLIERPLSVQISSEAAGLVGTVEQAPVAAVRENLAIQANNQASPDHILERVGSQRSYDFVR